jgi:hypothetical protein
MDAPHLSVAVYPDPGDDHTVDDIRALLLERDARPAFPERQGPMLVQRVPGHDSRPIEIVMSAGPLGDLDRPRRETVAFARHVTALLVAVTQRTRALYGGIGIESTFPTPADLRRGVHTQGVVTDPFFVRRDLLARSGLGSVLAREYRRTTESPAGTVFASWWPFVDGQAATPGGLSIWEPWAGGRLLGRVAARYLLDREQAATDGDQ